MDLQKKADIVRALTILATTEAGSGHPTSCMSAADITTVLFDKFFRYDIKNPHYENNDRLIFSKGHVAPLYYALFSLAGAVDRSELLKLRKINSVLEGHPTPRWDYVDAATGSLGQGLSIGAGMSLFAKRNNLDFKSIVLLGDGEFAEGQIYEAANFSSHEKLNNLIAIVDVNRLAQTGETMFAHDTNEYKKRMEATGWKTEVIDGHDFEEIEKALTNAYNNTSKKPYAIVAKTEKGKGASFLEGKVGHHGKALSEDDVDNALNELGVSKGVVDEKDVLFQFTPPKKTQKQTKKASTSLPTCHYEKGKEYATREVAGHALKELGDGNEYIYVVDGDVGNSTFTEIFADKHKNRFIQGYIAEQNMTGVGVGLSSMGQIPFVATFGAFLTRAYDQIRMAAISRANIKFIGSHAGISIGEDGPSQMALEDLSMFASIPDSVVLHPSDASSAHALPAEMANHKGISYLRTLRPKTQVIYKDDEKFPIGGSKTIKESKNDEIVIVACGITVHEALKAHEVLSKENIDVAVIDAYSIKPIDKKTILEIAEKTKKRRIVTVEDHYYHGGLGDMVAQAVSENGIPVTKMAVGKLPQSGTKDELLQMMGIDSESIARKIREILTSIVQP